MILKQLLGEIMADLGFVTKEQLEEALQRQRKIFQEKVLPERLQKARLIAEASLGIDKDPIPLLGQILTDMGFATKEQIDAALKEQDKTVEAYQALKSEKLGTAIELGAIVNSTLNLAEVSALIIRHVNRVTHSVASTLMLLDNETGELVFSVPTGPKADKLTDMRLPPGKGIAGWVAQHEEPLLVSDARKDPRFYTGIDEISGFETKSILCVPLKTKTKLIGVLEVINKEDGTAFTEEDATLLSIFAYQAGMAIENARRYSELKERFEEEMQIQKSLGVSEKLRALGQMASGVAHDFNNLLMGIQGHTSLMLLNVDSSHPHYQRLKKIEDSVEGGADLTKQLLDFARGEKYEVSPADLNNLIGKSSQIFGRTKEELKILKKFQKDIWTVNVDQGQITQVLLNLYVNAWQAMPGGGELHLETENVTLEGDDIKPFGLDPGNYVQISITDTGEGMDEETRQRIFDPFFTTKGIAIGTGLGLASTYGIIKNHRGIIDVHSEKDKGTTFHIYLPAAERGVKNVMDFSEETLKGKETVLLVDDEDIILDVGKQMLKKMGYQVLLAKGAKEAIEVYKENRDKIDLVILDMIMPEMVGDEAFDRLKEIDPKIKVLLSSGYNIDGKASELLERGCNGFIQKPFSMKQLSQKIREILDKI
jgi:signal transduction histidine kinase